MHPKERIQRAMVGLALRPLLRHARRDLHRMDKLIAWVDALSRQSFPRKTMARLQAGLADEENTWHQFAQGVLQDTDPAMLRRLLLSLGLGVANGTRLVRKNRETLGCNVPFIVLLDPTSACNLHCKGCWAGEYHKHTQLTLDEMDGIVRQAKALGTRAFMLTGGEPLIRKDDILTLAGRHRECAFLLYTNATLIDEELVQHTKRLGNILFAISLEGFEATNDARRGEGAFARSLKAMELLQRERCLYGISVCYTSQNVETVTSDAFLDMVMQKGAKFAMLFHYMPLGQHAVPELLPSAAQRQSMYRWLRKVRAPHGGKPFFVVDFQNDGEYVGGCIGGGRNYFHINSNGDMEPCVFIHYSDSNIRQHSLLEALQRPLFQAFYKGQPFNENHLRPCPMLENPQKLRAMVGESGAHSTDVAAPEDVEHLCAKCDRYAEHWQAVAQPLWEANPHPQPKTQYHRDRTRGVRDS